ncbi:ADP-ribose diphosphatase [Sodalis endosymbiont of Henestaris halophilus]|uniref:ADP-ribose diphosphatase n=1 Tax=Sodalis endosymbiont of Henestaris halophilus TaxID=1929246 RepID=UPI000BBF5429|nr:ADP-ribose diphosphatase [Sodalis endosymbiont of Henestaris halophilus]SNC58591.1 ADP-ribose pyrophosphatase [Sodalis endosymbiont of Henestaris halophilus]
MTSSFVTPVTFCRDDVEMLSRNTLYNGFFKMKLYHFRHKLFNGNMSQPVTREIFERGHAVVLLPYDAQRDQVILLEQIRIAAYDSSLTPWLLELVAGMIKPGETFEQVARREAVEETGLSVGRCKHMLSYLASPGSTSERLMVMVGEVNAQKAEGIHGLIDENEDIRLHAVSRTQAYCWVEEGVIDNAASVIALQWLALHHESLRKGWGY